MSFPCTKCGACCRKMGDLKEFLKLSYPDTLENGTCVHLLSDNSCEIYDNRPKHCRVDEAKKAYLPMISNDSFYRLYANECNSLIREENLDSKFLVEV